MDDTELMLDVGQANEIKLAARRAGATNQDLKRLSEGDMFAKILPVLRGMAKVEIVTHVIDCDADPFIPENWSVESHRKMGQLEFDLSKIRLHLDEGQQDGKSILGNDLRKKFADQPVLNANVLDYLLANPEMIPEDWKGKYVFFWGTIYRGSGSYLCVRYLSWHGSRWDWGFYWLVDGFYSRSPAALLAS